MSRRPRPAAEIAPQAGDDCRVHVRWRFAESFDPGVDVNPPSVADPGYHLRYWAECSGCGNTTPLRSCENHAAEDGHDHAYPGWQDMPVVSHRPYEETGNRKTKAWEAGIRRAYPPGWLERKGPVREQRTGIGTRHVPEYAPGGGYLMAVVRDQPGTPARREPDPVQESLFG